MLERQLMLELCVGRLPVACFLVGSHTQNLVLESSDLDYKVFTLPTFEDLYYGYHHSNSHITKDLDVEVHSLRRLPDFLWKSNISYLDCLFSKEIYLLTAGPLSHLLHNLIEARESIAKMNMEHLYNGCLGMSASRLKDLYKETESTSGYVAEYGYNIKQALHAYRPLDLLVRFAESGFDKFGNAFSYEDRESTALRIKRGEFSAEEFYSLLSSKRQ